MTLTPEQRISHLMVTSVDDFQCDIRHTNDQVFLGQLLTRLRDQNSQKTKIKLCEHRIIQISKQA